MNATRLTIRVELDPADRALLDAIRTLLERPTEHLTLVPDPQPVPGPATEPVELITAEVRPRDPRGNILRYLAAQPGGTIGDPSGRATAPLAAHVGARLTNVTHIVAQLEREGLVERHVGSRKTYRIAITADGLEQIGARVRPVRTPPPIPIPKAPPTPIVKPAFPTLGPIGHLGHPDEQLLREGAAHGAYGDTATSGSRS